MLLCSDAELTLPDFSAFCAGTYRVPQRKDCVINVVLDGIDGAERRLR